MDNITKERYEKNGIEVVADKLGELWSNKMNVREQLGHKNLQALTKKCDDKYKKCIYELNESTKQPNRRFIHNDLALKIIKNCRTDESCNLKRNLGFTLHDVINSKEQTVINSMKDAFEGENMQSQYTVLGYRIDLYFHKYKLAIEIDEFGHDDRNIDYKIERQRALERELDCIFIRINPDAIDFNIFKEINTIHRHIYQLTKQQTKQKPEKSIIDNLSKKLLEIEFKQHNQIKTSCLKWIFKNILPNYKL